MATRTHRFEDLFKIITRSIQIIGTDPKSKQNLVWKLKAIYGNTFVFCCLLIIIYSIIYHDFPNKNYAEVIKNGIMATVALMTIAKYNILCYHKKTLGHLIETMDQDIINSENYPLDEKEIITTYIKNKIRVSQIWGVCITVTCSMFPVKAFILMIYYAVRNEFRLIPIFDFTYPRFLEDNKEKPLVFTIIQLIDVGFDLCAWISSLGFDALAPIFLLHCCGELQLLRLRLVKTFSLESDPRKILKQLKDINCRLQAVYRFVSYTQSIFMILYEILMKITIVLVSFSGFQVMQALYRKETSLEFTSFFFASFTQFFLPCYYSNLLLETGELFRESIYSCGWEMKSDIKIRKTILLMLTRTMSPTVLRTLFVPISLDTFAETCRQCYAIYNILMAVE